MLLLNNIYCCDFLKGAKHIDSNSINFIFTSPPYNVGIEYDVWDDKMEMRAYYAFTNKWLAECYRILKPDGRIGINIPYEVNMRGRGGRTFIASEYWQMMKKIGFGYAGTMHLLENAPHRTKYTAFGSWLSASSPYQYNPGECVLIGYKDQWKRLSKGESSFTQSKEDKKEFIELVSGNWIYRAETKGLTKANFSFDLPRKAIKLLTYKDDIVLDPFMGSGTTLCAAKFLGRKYIGFDISQHYCDITTQRLQEI